MNNQVNCHIRAKIMDTRATCKHMAVRKLLSILEPQEIKINKNLKNHGIGIFNHTGPRFLESVALYPRITLWGD